MTSHEAAPDTVGDAEPDAETETELGALLDAMTGEEKVGQVNQRLFGWQCVERDGSGFRLTDTFLSELERGKGMGAIYGLFRADAWSGRSWENGIQPEERTEVVRLVDQAVRRVSPQGTGVLVVEEAPHGHQAIGGVLLPTNHTVAATWDPGLLEQAAGAVAEALAASGVHVALVSALDMLRDPRWGRSEECFGEDPLLAAELTRAVVTGMQGPDRSRVGAGGVAVVLKHLAGQGEAVGGRNGQSAVVGPHDLRQIHLPPVVAGIEAGVLGFMSAYNDVDGVPCCASSDLLTGFLREEHGFDGIVMADGFAVDQLQPMTGSLAASARAALLAGVDISLWDTSYALLGELASSDASVARALDQACRRVLTLKKRMGLLNRAVDVPPARERVEISAGERREAAEVRASELSAQLAQRSLVLLTNTGGTLPLDGPAVRKVVVAGPYADDVTALLGDYVPPLPIPGITAQTARSVLGGLRAALGTAEILVPAEQVPTAAELEGADAVVVVLGGTSHRSYEDDFAANGAIASAASVATCGEGVDRADVSLPHGQDELFAAICDASPCPVVAVVVAGRPHVLTEVAARADAVLWAGYPGPGGGDAVASTLLGVTPPVGRLPMTLPSHPGAVPVRYNDRQSAARVYQDVPEPVLFPFGHGLGYCEVDVLGLTAEVDASGVTLTADVRSGGTAVHPVVLPVLAHKVGGRLMPRRQEMVAFRRCDVGPETTQVVWRLPLPTCFADPDDTGSWTDLTVLGRTVTVRPV